MRVYGKLILCCTLFISITAGSQLKNNDFIVIEGKVVDEVTAKPVEKIHVYVIEGEEEALTSAEGEFRIKTWQKLPLRLTVVNYTNHEKLTLVVADNKKQVIRLKNKMK